MPERQDAWAQLARTLAEALQQFAANTPRDDDAALNADAVVGQQPRPADEHALGRRQQQIVELSGMAAEEGMKTADIAAAIEYEVPNTYTALQALVRSQVVEQVPRKGPQRWRLVGRYRAGSRVVARLAQAVRPGEWTTAGDVSIAARGDLQVAEAIVRASLSHRVLAADRAFGEAREQLTDEGVAFLDDGRADPRQRVSWDELARRVAAQHERRRSMTRKAVLNYVQIPASNLEESITFYEHVLGWKVTRQPTLAQGADLEQSSYPQFTDSTGQAGGGFVLGRPPSREPGVMPCIAVDSIDDILNAVTTYGGEIVKPRTPIVEGVDWEAIFRDPAGNAFGL
jgi:predicted enzyme related to lactoylglutathione lyase